MKVENESPSITYESFVEELDEGDAFTTTLIDVLVKVRVANQCMSHAPPQQATSVGVGRTQAKAQPCRPSTDIRKDCKNPPLASGKPPRLSQQPWILER